ncbi:hypothetical protein D917_05945 [Trichinella nativa]|uniref:Uncharacterized protein n=1 Tax=Trichinella nativa TaxID=6335 RepID=A0A1Y3EV44_9BILA|nr:hypothetical protein D917_05945 [Trichinella nativa]
MMCVKFFFLFSPGFDQCTLCKDGQAPNPKSNDCSCKRGYYFNAKHVKNAIQHAQCAMVPVLISVPNAIQDIRCWDLRAFDAVEIMKAQVVFAVIRCLGSFTSSQYSIKTVVIGSCISAAILFIVIFGALMTCDWYRNSRNAYEYSNVPIYFNSDSVKLLENEYDEKFEEHDNQLSHVQDDSDVVIDVLMERA